jgi:hypothetical protein
MDSALLVIISALLAPTLIAAFEYYSQLRKATREYRKAKGAVDDIILSFNRQFRSEETKLEALGYRVEASASRSDGAIKKAVEIDGILRALENKVAVDLDLNKSVTTRILDVEKKAEYLALLQEEASRRIASLEEKANQPKPTVEPQLEGAIPLKREKAMGQLTGTELAVLEFLVTEGAKTAPEIKERIKLSREHTARLMKKLYEEGYLERETGNIPFKYSAKKEMGNLLRGTEN